MPDTPMHLRHDVWTYNDRPEWLARNCYIPDMVLAGGMAPDRADFTARRLAEMFPGVTFEVRDIHGDTIRQYGTHRDRTSHADRPARRKLGNR